MEYERIHKPLAAQGGGFSPKKLRKVLLRVERRRNEEEEMESKASLRSEPSEVESGRASEVDSCKDVECSIPNRSRDLPIAAGRIRVQEDDALESDSASAGFEFQKAERTQSLPPNRSTATAGLVPPFSKPAPSKWDDAQKWIASPTSNRGGNKGGGGGQARKGGLAGYITRQASSKFVLDAVEEADTKRVDVNVNHAQKETDSAAMPGVVFDNSDANPSWHDLSTTQSATAFMTPAATVRAVSMRDMGTEMTPVASQEPSRTGTPIRTASPSTLQKTATCSTQTYPAAGNEEQQSIREVPEKEQRKTTRREILMLGQQLGKTNIAAWAGKEEEATDASTSTKTVSKEEDLARSAPGARAAAWEEAEKAKYLARFKSEEIKIVAWENHQKATIEAETRKVEVEVERLRASAYERLMNQLAAVRHKAEDKRAAAEAKRNQEAAKTAQQADYIRRTGRIPSRFSCWSWCSYCRFL
ncbi:uncharacterized protein LOC122045991 [Zingiber officinale]|uniref:Remorin C-terminal domain-containing protein n=1 Tax=Zingiber officinale TaxID=94328 RepID=A0A8J5HH64_ZINOF|nr:uncharacterized protein LOC122045991 [Zingiber officinale]KAG6524426.1 hypothetical protein ZIOFF_014335 [Zingiber officinale]